MDHLPSPPNSPKAPIGRKPAPLNKPSSTREPPQKDKPNTPPPQHRQEVWNGFQAWKDKQIAQANEALSKRPDVNRTIIAALQKNEAEKMREDLTTLLKKYLPHFVFNVDPEVQRGKKKNEQNQKLPSIIEQQVARAQANAEAAVYLSYIRSLKNKGAFLQEWNEVRSTRAGKNSERASLMRAHMREEYDKLPKSQQAVFEKDRYSHDPVSGRYTLIHRKNDPKYSKNATTEASLRLIRSRRLQPMA